MLKTRPKTKIICTLGPSTSSAKAIQNLVESGMNVARLNMSHGTIEEHLTAFSHVRRASKRVGVPVGIMVDIPGSKYRIGPLGVGFTNLKVGDRLILTSADLIGTRELVSVFPPGIEGSASVNGQVFVDDGKIELRVVSIQDREVECKVVRGGRLTERRGVVTPGQPPPQLFPTDSAREALEFAARVRADFVALSMVATDEHVHLARELLRKGGLEDTYIISKIELAQALECFDRILDASDGIMVARGDMGVEVPLAKVPMIQKDLITRCNIAGKPVITATQMLESMIVSPVPTRAEVTDVANAIYDGTDSIMLSGETSVGKYPTEAVKVMTEVAIQTEDVLPYDRILEEKGQFKVPKTEDAISYDACQTALQLKLSLIIAFTESGGTAGRVSKYRPKAPILALTPSEVVQRRLTLRWGVTAMTVPSIRNVDGFFQLGEEHAKSVGGVKPGNEVVLVAGLPIGVKGGTNLLRVLTVSGNPR